MPIAAATLCWVTETLGGHRSNICLGNQFKRSLRQGTALFLLLFLRGGRQWNRHPAETRQVPFLPSFGDPDPSKNLSTGALARPLAHIFYCPKLRGPRGDLKYSSGPVSSLALTPSARFLQRNRGWRVLSFESGSK